MAHAQFSIGSFSRLVLAAASFFVFSLPSQALAGESELTAEVQVDVAGKDSADAREQAMTKGYSDGLVDLLSKLTSPDQVQLIMSNLEPGRVASMVRGTEVLDEKISAGRYRARLMLTYDGDEISKLIDAGGTGGNVQGSSNAVGSFLIIPGYEEDGVPMLWEEGNPWRAACRSMGLEIATGDIVVPYGDGRDSAIVDARTLASATYASLAPMTVRYGVSDIMVVAAKYSHNPDPQLDIVKRRINRTQNEVSMQTYRADPQESKEALMNRAARDLATQIQHKKTEELETVKAVQGGDRHSVMMLASISTLSSWTDLRTRLSTLPMIDRLEVLAIAPQQVDLIVHYRGEPASLAQAIDAQNLRLQQNDNYWVISRD